MDLISNKSAIVSMGNKENWIEKIVRAKEENDIFLVRTKLENKLTD